MIQSTLTYTTYACYTYCVYSVGRFAYTWYCNRNKPKNVKTGTIEIDTTKNKSSGLLMQLLFGNSNPTCIDEKVYESFLTAYKKYDKKEDITIEIKTWGGNLNFSLLIANVIYHHEGKVNCRVNDYATSGGTLIALACDKIYMGNTDVLSKVDPQMSGGILPSVPLLAIMENLANKDPHDMNLVENILKHLSDGCIEGYLPKIKMYLSKNHDEMIVEKIIEKFVYSKIDHSSIILRKDLEFMKNICDK